MGEAEQTEEQQQHEEHGPSQEEVEKQARDMGWRPKDKWQGDPEKWVDAAEFNKRGETFVPFLRNERVRLKAELAQRDQRDQQLQDELRATRETVESLKTFNADMAKERTERRKVEIQSELRTAREAGDDVKVAELQQELGEVIKPPTTATPPARTGPTQPTIAPWVKSFIDGHNEFFEGPQKIRNVALFNALVIEKRSAGDTRVGEADGTAFLQEVTDEVEQTLRGGNPRRQAVPKTEDGRPPNSGGGGGGKGKGYADLPSEARAKCDQQAKKFVGKPGFKDEAAWRRHFVTEYYGPSAREV